MARAKLVAYHETNELYGIRIDCPGGHYHVLPVMDMQEKPWAPPGYKPDEDTSHPRWKFNGDLERPTFEPSILMRSGHFLCNDPSHAASTTEPKRECAICKASCRICSDPKYTIECGRCHSFVRNGRIEFLNDCSHALAGQTVDLPEIDIIRLDDLLSECGLE